MYTDLILKPKADKTPEKNLFIWMDYCGPHKTACLDQVYKDAHTEVGLLPPNMTSKLQVLDLVINGPIFAGLEQKEYAITVNNIRTNIMNSFEQERQSPHFQSGRCLNHRCKNASKT